MGGRLGRVGLSFFPARDGFARPKPTRYAVVMKMGACWALGLLALAGCSRGEANAAPAEVVAAVEPSGLVEYDAEDVSRDDPRERIRGALAELGHEDQIPDDATQEELEALLSEKADTGLIPREHAEKVLKVLQTAHARNDRLERLDQQLFDETTQ